MNLEQLLKSIPKKQAPRGFTNRVMLSLGFEKRPSFWPVFLPRVVVGLLILWLGINFYQSGTWEIINLWITEGKILSLEFNEWLAFILSEAPLMNLALVIIMTYFLIKRPKFYFPRLLM